MRWLVDVLVTLLLWVYFTVGFLAVFFPLYLVAYPLRASRERRFQRLTSWFFCGFLGFARALMPGVRFRVSPEVRDIRSAVIICNHRSYLDTLLMLATFPHHRTIAKPVWFKIPLFGWVVRNAGYIPPAVNVRLSALMVRQIDSLPEHLAGGGNLFVFPEGTRSRDGRLGPFLPGAFKLARRAASPIEILVVRHTEVLFPPGRFLWHATRRVVVSLERLGRIEASEVGEASVSRLVARSRAAYDKAA